MWCGETIQIIGALGNWFAGLGAFAAVGVALWLAKRSEKVKLNASVGLRIVVRMGQRFDRAPEILNFHITNAGQRPVNITGIGWKMGRGKYKKFAIQTLSTGSPDNFPKLIAHGESASFVVDLDDNSEIITSLAEGIKGVRDTKTIRTLIYTSIGRPVVVKPEDNFLNRIKEEKKNAANRNSMSV